MTGIVLKPTINYRLHPFRLIFLTTIFLLDHHDSTGNKAVSGQAITPMLEQSEGGSGTIPFLRSFLESCQVITLQTQCSEEEYESNEDCLPQKKDNCDHSKDLFCLSGVCLPNCHPHKETYDHIEGKCFRKVDSDCRSHNTSVPSQLSPFPDEDNNIINIESQSPSYPTTTVFVSECVKNAFCEWGKCRCVSNFIYDPVFGKCMLYANYASYCNDTIACDKMSDISCIENQCQCASPQLQYYHLKRKRCYTLIGQVCSTGLQFCPDNSNCIRNKVNDSEINRAIRSSNEDSVLLFTPPTSQYPSQRDGNYPPGGDPHSRLRLLHEEKLSGRYGVDDGVDTEEEYFIGILGADEGEKEFVCKCDKGFGSTRDKRFCLGLHGTRCNTLHRCNMERGLKCIDGICLCDREKGYEQIFSEQFQTCITRPGALCVEDEQSESKEDICPIGGTCKQGNCVCDQSLTAATTSFYLSKTWVAYSCLKSHGESCKTHNSSEASSNSSLLPEGIDSLEPLCNEEIGLECNTKEKKCLCRDINQFYDTRVKACRNLQGVDTKIPVIHFTPPEDREYNFRKNSATKTNSMLASGKGIVLLVYIIDGFLNFY